MWQRICRENAMVATGKKKSHLWKFFIIENERIRIDWEKKANIKSETTKQPKNQVIPICKTHRSRWKERDVVVVLGIRQQQHLRRGELGVPLIMLNNTNNHIIHI